MKLGISIGKSRTRWWAVGGVAAVIAVTMASVATAPAANASFVGFETVAWDSDGQLRAFTPSGMIATGAFMAPGTSPAVADLGNGGVELAFVGPDRKLWRASPETNWFRAGFELGRELGVAAGTSPAVASNGQGGWKIAFHGSNGHLWTIDSSSHLVDTGAGLAPGTSPALAWLPSAGGYEIAFVGPDSLLWRAFPDTNWFRVGAGLGVAPGTSPAIATNGSGNWKIAFHAQGDHLWTVDGANNAIDTGAGLAPGTSPALAWLPSAGGYEIAFVGPDSLLWRAFPDTNWFRVGAGLAVAPGTSPAIATDGGSWRIAFHAQGDHLLTVDGTNNPVDTGTRLAAGTSPAIAARSSGPVQPPPSSSGPPTSTVNQVKTYRVENCDSNPPFPSSPVGGSKSIWVDDRTAGTGFRMLDNLQGITAGHVCGPSDRPDSFTFTPVTGHLYELRVITYQRAGCSNSPNSCLSALPATFVGNASGRDVVLTVFN